MGAKAWVGLAICIGMLTTNLVVAADWSLVPSVTQKSEFNSNLDLTYSNPISDYIFFPAAGRGLQLRHGNHPVTRTSGV